MLDNDEVYTAAIEVLKEHGKLEPADPGQTEYTINHGWFKEICDNIRDELHFVHDPKMSVFSPKYFIILPEWTFDYVCDTVHQNDCNRTNGKPELSEIPELRSMFRLTKNAKWDSQFYFGDIPIYFEHDDLLLKLEICFNLDDLDYKIFYKI